MTGSIFVKEDIIASSEIWKHIKEKLKDKLSEMEINAIPFLAVFIASDPYYQVALNQVRRTIKFFFGIDVPVTTARYISIIAPLYIVLTDFGIPDLEAYKIIKYAVAKATKALKEVKKRE